VKFLIVMMAAVGMVSDAPPVRIDVRPRILFAGGAIRLTCRVTPHADNRKLHMGFGLWTESYRELEGADAKITWEHTFNKVPCDPGPAYCIVVKNDGRISQSALDVEVKGCDGNPNQD
jgi:hypothetical protein